MWTATRPATPTICTWTELQAQLRLDDTTDQTLVMDYLDAATEYAEMAMDCSLITRTMTTTSYSPDSFHLYPNMLFNPWQPASRIYLPRGPVQSITSAIDANGTVLTSQLQRYGNADTCVLTSTTYTPPVTVTYVAGFGATAASIPADIRMALRTHVATLWKQRASTSDRAAIPVPHSLEAFYKLRRRATPVA